MASKRAEWKKALWKAVDKRLPRRATLPTLSTSGTQKVKAWLDEAESECPPVSESNSFIGKILEGGKTANPLVQTTTQTEQRGALITSDVLEKECKEVEENGCSVSAIACRTIMASGCEGVTGNINTDAKSAATALDSPANKVHAVSSSSGRKAEAVMKKDISQYHTVKRKLAFSSASVTSCKSGAPSPHSEPSAECIPSSIEKDAVKQKFTLTSEKLHPAEKSMSSEQYVCKERDLLHGYACAEKASGIAIETNLTTSDTAISKGTHLTYDELTVHQSSYSDKIFAFGSDDGLVTTGMEKLAVASRESTIVTVLTPVPVPKPRISENATPPVPTATNLTCDESTVYRSSYSDGSFAFGSDDGLVTTGMEKLAVASTESTIVTVPTPVPVPRPRISENATPPVPIATNVTCDGLTVNHSSHSDESFAFGSDGGLATTRMEKLKVARTKITTVTVLTPVPVPRARLSSQNTTPPVPKARKIIPPSPAPRRLSVTSTPRCRDDEISLLDVNHNDSFMTPKPLRKVMNAPIDLHIDESSMDTDENTLILPVINVEDIDPEIQRIISSNILTPPNSASHSVFFSDGMAIVSPPFKPEMTATATPLTPPETPEVPFISSEIDISTSASVTTEEPLATPLPENFNETLENDDFIPNQDFNDTPENDNAALNEDFNDTLEDENFIPDEDHHPPVKETYRKRQKKSSKQNQAKAALNKGLEHYNVKGKLIPARVMRKGCTKCRFKCNEKLSEDERLSIFKKYWALGDKQLQDAYIRECIVIKDPATHIVGEDVKQKTHTIKYSFKFPQRGQVFVCKSMFLDTLGISESPVRTQMRKLERGITTVSPDKRGRHSKVDPEVKKKNDNNIMEHIKLFKTIPSHFCRLRSKRKYLAASLTIRHMWRLYKSWMTKNKPGDPIKSEKYYRKIFCTKFNLGFHKPKKDRCDLCLVFEIGTAAQRRKLKAKYDEHIRNKTHAKAARKKDEAYAKSSRDTVCYCLMDLQQVISLPKTEAGMVFYKRNLSAYNFTIYDKIRKKGYCYLWDESEAKRGANEIATCVLLFIAKKVSEGIKDFIFWSDNCGGQNKNKYLFAAYTWAATQFQITITHRYMERGHTMNEADSMHATIEYAARYEQIYVPLDLVPIIQNAKRKGNKYDVELVGSKILDFHHLADKLQNWADKKAKWRQVREITVDNERPGKVFIKHDLSAPSQEEIKITKVGRQTNLATYEFPKAFHGPVQLKQNKLKDLACLCKELVIPSQKHAFYKALLNFPDLTCDLLHESGDEESEDDEGLRQIAEKEFLFDYDNDEERMESDYEEEVQIAKDANIEQNHEVNDDEDDVEGSDASVGVAESMESGSVVYDDDSSASDSSGDDT